MKGVLLSACPNATLVDISHAIPAFDVAIGAFVLWAGTRNFPVGSVHLAVVDPTVGTDRRAIALESDGRMYVGPDNGLFEMVLQHGVAHRAVALPRPPEASRTFEGRDVFAPAAAALAGGQLIGEVGRAIADVVRIPEGGPRVLWVDHFGNLVTSVRPPIAGLRLRGQEVRRHAVTYGEAGAEEPFWYVGSLGYVEIGLPRRRADRLLAARPGDQIEVLTDVPVS